MFNIFVTVEMTHLKRQKLFSINKSLYLADDTRYRHSYCRRRIENRTQAFEWSFNDLE